MIGFRIIEYRCIGNFSRDRPQPMLLQRSLIYISALLNRLTISVIKSIDHASISGSNVVALAHPLRRVMFFPKHAQQGSKVNGLWIVNHENNFRMSGEASTSFFIGWVRSDPASISNRGHIHAW